MTVQNLLEVKPKIKKLQVLLLPMKNVQKNQRKYHMLIVSFTLMTKQKQ